MYQEQWQLDVVDNTGQAPVAKQFEIRDPQAQNFKQMKSNEYQLN